MYKRWRNVDDDNATVQDLSATFQSILKQADNEKKNERKGILNFED